MILFCKRCGKPDAEHYLWLHPEDVKRLLQPGADPGLCREEILTLCQQCAKEEAERRRSGPPHAD